MLGMGVIAAIVVVVVLVVVVGGLYAAGVGPFAKSTTNASGGSGESFSQAAAAASPSTSGVSGGPWSLVGGSGEQFATAGSVSPGDLNISEPGDGCAGALLPGASSITSFPATSASASSGDATDWLMLYTNSAHAMLEVAVLNGGATPIYKANGFGVCTIGSNVESLVSASYVDSPQAAGVAWSAGGSTFSSEHPTITASYNLVPTITATVGGFSNTVEGAWSIEMTNCAVFGSGTATVDGKAPGLFYAEVNATSGALIRAENYSSCSFSGSTGGTGGGKPTLTSSSVFTFVSEVNSGPSQYWNNGSFYISGSYTLTLSDLTLSIENASTSAAVSTTGFTLQLVDLSSMSVLSSYNFGTSSWSTPSAPIGSSFTSVLALYTTSSMAGNKMVLSATSAAPCTGSISATMGP